MSNSIDTKMQSMLQEMQAMQSSMKQSAVNKTHQQQNGSFEQLFVQALKNVNDQQVNAEQLQMRHEMGDQDADLVSVMLATQQANLSFQSMMQVRNRLLNAYREMMNMPM